MKTGSWFNTLINIDYAADVWAPLVTVRLTAIVAVICEYGGDNVN